MTGRFAFLIYRDETASETRTPAQIAAGMAAHTPYIEMLRRNQRYAGSEALGAAAAARTVRLSNGKPLVTEGPFAESREQFGGFYLIRAESLDEAIELASQCPALTTVGVGIEIRPVQPIATRSALDEGEPRARFMLGFHGEEPGEDGTRDAFSRWMPTLERLEREGLLVHVEPFAASGSATSLRLHDGKLALTDGPFDERGSPLAALCMLRARDLDEAVRVAVEWPGLQSRAIEVRAVRTPGA